MLVLQPGIVIGLSADSYAAACHFALLIVGCGGCRLLSSGLSAMQVQSVDSHKGMLTGCCAASHDRTIAVYPANVVPGEVAKHKAVWQAHGRTITALHANRFCPTLLSGDDAGQIFM